METEAAEGRHETATEILRALSSHATELLMLVRNDGVTHGDMVLGAAPLGFPEELRRQSRHVAEVVHPDDLLRVFELIEEVQSTPGMSTTVQVRAKHYDGSWRVLQVDVFDESADPVLEGVVLRIRDATPFGDALASSIGAHREFESLAEVVPCGILTADRRGHLVYANDAAQRILGLPEDALFGRAWESVIHAADRGEVLDAANRALDLTSRDSVMFRVERDGGEHWVAASFVSLGDRDHSTGWVATIEDVTERRRNESRLAHQATHDPLTGLPNRTLLDDRLRQAMARLERSSGSVSVLFVDLDDFKSVNDRLGHAAGDRMLVHVGERLRSLVRTEDTLARFGGDEFVVVVEGVGREDAFALGTRIVESLDEPVLLQGARVHVPASVGVATTRATLADPEHLLLAADAAMYRAKNQGGCQAILGDVDDLVGHLPVEAADR